MSSVAQVKARYGIVGQDARLEHAIFTALQVARTDVSVLIHGESGTGKEVFSKIIHQYSIRKHNSFIAVNCGAIPEGTIDSELFGHEKGSFTGAYEARKGYFEEANRGTLFLDEIAEMPLATQARLLRVLETGEFIKVGSSVVQRTDVRVVAATNVDLLDSIGRGQFRQDLYYRLNTVPIYLPPLRDRAGDVVLLFIKFATDFADRYGAPVPTLTKEAEALLRQGYFAGNIRQLKNLAEQVSLLEQDAVIDAGSLEKYLPTHHRLPMVLEKKEESLDQGGILERLNRLEQTLYEVRALVLRLLDKQGQEPVVLHSLTKPKPLELPSAATTDPSTTAVPSLEEMEKKMIQQVLETCQYRRKDAADLLGISERTLYRKIKQYDL